MAETVPMKLIAVIAVALCITAFSAFNADVGRVLAANSPADNDAKTGSGNPGADQGGAQKSVEKEKTPEEKMQARFPQPAKVGHLIGLPILDFDDSTIGYVKQVVRTPDGKIRLIMPYGKRFGWARNWWPFTMGRRLIAVPIETVAILALQIDALDMARSDFDAAPTWDSVKDQALLPHDTVKIALARR